jgi:hypothetical protein
MAGDARAKELLDLGGKLFTTKLPYDSLCQEIAINIYPERADFITPLILGQEFSAHLADSFPVLTRRELGNSLSGMLRPRQAPWFKCSTGIDDIDNDPACAQFLEYITTTTRAAMYDARAKFIRATKEGDHDYVSFGQPVISIEESPDREHIFYRCHHLRDCAWLENEVREIDHLHRKDKMSARAMMRKFKPAELHQTIKKAAEKEPNKEFNLRVVALPADEYDSFGSGSGDSKRRKLPFIVVYIDQDNECIIREAPSATFPYMVPRWQTISGSQYSFSPAAMTSLPDTRMAQALASIILEAGEKQINPPMIARDEVIRDASLQAGAITWADIEGDGKVSDHFSPINLGADMKTAFAMQQGLRETLSRAFFIDKLSLPDSGTERTAYEISQLLEQHVRNLLPIIEPVETEYNTQLLDKTFAVEKNMGHYDFSLMPDRLRKLSTPPTWKFINPMQQVSDRILVQQYQEALQVEASANQAGVTVPRTNLSKARDDAIRGIGVPADWRRTDEEMEQDAQQQKAQQAAEAAAQTVSQGAGLASQVADASQRVGQAMLSPGQGQPMKALPAPQKQQKPTPLTPRAA